MDVYEVFSQHTFLTSFIRIQLALYKLFPASFASSLSREDAWLCSCVKVSPVSEACVLSFNSQTVGLLCIMTDGENMKDNHCMLFLSAAVYAQSSAL